MTGGTGSRVGGSARGAPAYEPGMEIWSLELLVMVISEENRSQPAYFVEKKLARSCKLSRAESQ
ncbi:hypothetical protein E2562_015899 [Oryza meyeriana var. granulata]|uniref:Uncharacterized protein n=1 Tax=Oryza meyeriana var. granulata TaxID=110450 RepID=A0A6G1CGS7_9ORYZ|nr:hypothetical protein E2562_015899 [Oryza meyeriana var. granulata]